MLEKRRKNENVLIMSNICNIDPHYRKLLPRYCAYIRQCFEFAEANIEYNMIKRKKKGLKFALVMDFDGVFMAEGSCLDNEMFSCTISFVQFIYETYGNSLPIYIITARREPSAIINVLAHVGMSVGPGVKNHIRAVYCDNKNIGTARSKIENRNRVRDAGYNILCTIGDNVLDLQTEQETDGYADTINILLPNVWRQRSLKNE